MDSTRVDNLKKVVIAARTLQAFKEEIGRLDTEAVCLYFEAYPGDLVGREFDLHGHTFVITGADVDIHKQEPLLFAMRNDCTQYNNDVTDEGDIGYTNPICEPSGRFPSIVTSHTGMKFTDNEIYAKGIPHVVDGTMIGLHWIPLSGVMNYLSELPIRT